MTDQKTNTLTVGFTQTTLEMAGHYVRTAITNEDRRGNIIAEFPFHNPRWMEDAQLFMAAADLLKVAHLVIDTATIETPEELLNAAFNAVKKARYNVVMK